MSWIHTLVNLKRAGGRARVVVIVERKLLLGLSQRDHGARSIRFVALADWTRVVVDISAEARWKLAIVVVPVVIVTVWRGLCVLCVMLTGLLIVLVVIM